MAGSIMFSGVLAAAATPFNADGSIASDRFAEHCTWLVDNGVTTVVPNGSLGEYETMTDDERAGVVQTAAAAIGAAKVIPGVSGKSAREAIRWAEHAKSVGCPAVMCLPPTSHAPTDDEVVAHFEAVASVGLPVIAYNNPFSTRVDLTPALLHRLDAIDGIAAVKEFSQDVRRVAAIREQAPGIEIIVGCDDLLAEAVLMGATGWIAGFANAVPESSVRLLELCLEGRWDEALPLYRQMLPALRWDADPRFVQAIKLTMDDLGRYGGPVRLPRRPLSAQDEAAVRATIVGLK